MKRIFPTLILLALVICAPHCYGQDGTNRVQPAESTFKGAVLLVKPTEDPYRLGMPILVSVTLTNISGEVIHLVEIAGHNDYRASLFRADGTSLQSREPANRQQDGSVPDIISSRHVVKLAPGRSVSSTLDLRDAVQIEKEGTYYLVLSRRIWSWETGFVVSDKIKIDVVK